MAMASLTMILNSSDAIEDEDEGPFIDLEFSIPDEEYSEEEDSENSTLSLSPSNDFFSLDSTNSKPPFPSSLLKSATKLRVFMLGGGSKKPKPTTPSSPKQQRQSSTVNNFVRFKVEQVPLVSLFTRDNSEKVKSSKEVVHRYLNKIKKLRFSGQHGSVVAVEKQSGKDCEMALQGGGSSSPLRLVAMRRRLGKSRSASAAVAAVRSPPRRRDDSLLQQQDGIQSAIAHCKRSFHADKGVETQQQLVRSNSDPGEIINQLKFK